LSATVSGQGWSADLAKALAAVRFNGSQPVAVHISHTGSGQTAGIVTLKAVSESDAHQSAAANCATAGK
jgi:hypothetical protein